MYKKYIYPTFLLINLFTLVSCDVGSHPSILNRRAEALLTNQNELQFRFEINEKVLTNEKVYKVKVHIHNKELAIALGNDEFVYGAEEVFNGRSLNVNRLEDKKTFISMDPIPLMRDFHIWEIDRMITEQKAVSIEIISNEVVMAKTFLTKFRSQM